MGVGVGCSSCHLWLGSQLEVGLASAGCLNSYHSQSQPQYPLSKDSLRLSIPVGSVGQVERLSLPRPDCGACPLLLSSGTTVPSPHFSSYFALPLGYPLSQAKRKWGQHPENMREGMVFHPAGLLYRSPDSPRPTGCWNCGGKMASMRGISSDWFQQDQALGTTQLGGWSLKEGLGDLLGMGQPGCGLS